MPPHAAVTEQRKIWAHVKRAERSYSRNLRSISRQIGVITKELAPHPDSLEAMLREYAQMLVPWARSVASRMLSEALRRDDAAWNRLSKTMSRALAEEIRGAPIGGRLRELQQQQVTLITSLPLEAAERVHALALEIRVSTAGRAKELAAAILASGDVSKARANCIARTETARVASNLTQARAEFVGSEGYIWRTAGDLDVRKLHQKLNGQFVRWDAPPVAGKSKAGEIRAHAGCFPNCRCYAEPVVPEV